MKILIASRNAHKIQEIREIFDLPGVEWVSTAAFPDLYDVVEDGDTFEANAVKKATEQGARKSDALRHALKNLKNPDPGLTLEAFRKLYGRFTNPTKRKK